jgi:hypothetical protein
MTWMTWSAHLCGPALRLTRRVAVLFLPDFPVSAAFVPSAAFVGHPMSVSARSAAVSAESLAQAARKPASAAASAAARIEHDRMANAIRTLAMDAVERAKSGPPGLPMGAADIATALFTRFLKFDPADPAWPDPASCFRPAMARCCFTRSFISSAPKR